MAGFAHFFLGLSIGFILMWASDRRFTSRHLIVFSVNNYLGPDIGTLFWFFFGRSGGTSNLFGTIIIQIFHTPYGWSVVSLLYALLWVQFTRLDLEKAPEKALNMKWVKDSSAKLKYSQCYELCVAGGILHFFLDILTTSGAAEYEWYISTGTWGGKAYFTWFAIIYFVIWVVTYFSLFILFSRAISMNDHNKLKWVVIIVMISSSLYVIILFYVLIALKLPAVGEESDAGAIPFFAFYLILPIIIAVHSSKTSSSSKKQGV